MKKAVAVAVCCLLSTQGGPSLSAAEGLASEEMIFFQELPQVVTGSLQEVSLDRTPSSMTVITGEDIERMGYDTLLDALRGVVGVELYRDQEDDGVPIIRGYSPPTPFSVRYMLNGHPLNDLFAGLVRDYNYMPLANIKQIEIVRGPGSALFGEGALSGVVNIITKDRPGFVVESGAGEWNASHGVFSYTSEKARKDGFRIGLQLENFNEDGPKVRYAADGNSTSPAPFFSAASRAPLRFKRGTERGAGSVRTSYRGFDFDGYYSKHRGEWPIYNYSLTAAPPLVTENEKYAGVLTHRRELTPSLSLKYTLDYTLSKIRFAGPLTPKGFNLGGGDVNFDGVPDVWPEGVRIDASADDSVLINDLLMKYSVGRHSIHFGTTYSARWLSNVDTKRNFGNFFDVAPFYHDYRTVESLQDKPLNRTGHFDVFSVMAHDIYDVSHRVTLTLGVRHDRYSFLDETATSPRADLVWHFSDDLIVKAGHGSAYSVPGYSYKFLANTPGGYIGNPELDPVRIRSYEVSIGNSHAKRWHYSLTGYRNDVRDSVTQVSVGGILQYLNTSKYANQGLEWEGKWKALSALDVWGNYAYLDSKDEKTGEAFPNTTSHVANVGTTWRPAKPLSWSVNIHAAGERRSDPLYQGKKDLPGYAAVNTSLLYKPVEPISVTLAVYNLLDKEYASPAEHATASDLPQDPRQVRVKVKYSF